jgi:hypothetical protein
MKNTFKEGLLKILEEFQKQYEKEHALYIRHNYCRPGNSVSGNYLRALSIIKNGVECYNDLQCLRRAWEIYAKYGKLKKRSYCPHNNYLTVLDKIIFKAEAL